MFGNLGSTVYVYIYTYIYIYVGGGGESRKPWKSAHPGEDNSDIEPGPARWGFSTGLVTRSYKNCYTQIPQRREARLIRDQHTLQEDGTDHAWPNP
jgi:hypothetical protein